MQVILLERIGKLGQMGDVVTVKDGYARNFLLPQGKALRANKSNMTRFETERVQLEAHNLERRTEAEAVSTKIDGEAIVVIRQAGDNGQLYGSVSTRDIAAEVTAAGFEIKRRQVLLDSPIKVLGLHPVRIALHPEVEVAVSVNVARSQDEAERQARGEDVSASDEPYDEEEETISVEEVFEDKELAEEVLEELTESEQEEAREAELAAKKAADWADAAANDTGEADEAEPGTEDDADGKDA